MVTIGNPITVNNLNGNYLPITQFSGLGVSHSSPEFLVAGAMHNHSYRYQNDNWSNFHSSDGGDCEVNWEDPSIYFTQAVYTTVRRYKDDTYTNLTKYGGFFIGMKFELNPYNPYKVYMGRGQDDAAKGGILNIWTDSDQGINSTPVKKYLPQELSQVGAICIRNNNAIYIDDTIYISDFVERNPGTANRFVRSIDGGDNWEDFSGKDVTYNNKSGISVTESLNLAIGYKSITDIEINSDDLDEMWITISSLKRDNNGNGILRVLHSTNAGESWVDYSDGLTVFPCNTIEYVPGSDGLLFVGTDIGVFYRDNSMSQWECFLEGIPVCIVTELELQPRSNVLYASTFGRGVWKTYLPCETGSQTNQISTTTTWNINQRIIDNITIETGATLTINNNAVISMGEDNIIIVEPGGKLIIEDNALITSGGGCSWKGISVLGDPSNSQVPESNQGVVEIKTGGSIENAIAAIQAPGNENPYNAHQFGGIIRADDAVFRNNETGIVIKTYENFISSTNEPISNLSYVKNCLFEINNDYFSSNATPSFIQIRRVDGIQILGNTFVDNSSKADPAIHADGILAYDASFYVDPICIDVGTPCNDWDKNHFEGLNYGIRAMNTSPDRTLSISTSEFENVYRGIFLSGVSNATIILNEFEIPDINTLYSSTYTEPYTDKESYGLYLNECNAYIVEENVFESFSSSGYTSETYGVIVNNSHEPPNEIYNNDFDDLECGILGVNDNRSIPGQAQFTGLKIKCNNIISTYKDIDVRNTTQSGSAIRGLSEYQGYENGDDETAPAGNRFTQNCSPGSFLTDFDNDHGEFITYYHHGGDASNGDRWVPKCYSDNILLEPVPVNFDESSACPTNFDNGSGGLSLSELYSELDTELQQKNSSILIYNIWKDGGDTEQLELEVELALPPESYELYNELIGESPYLSDDVLIAAIENEDVLTSLMIKLIMIANPQSTRSDGVMDALYSRVNPLPESWIDEIISGTAYASQLEKLEATYSQDNHEYIMILNDIKSLLLQDTIFSWKKDSLINLLLQQDDLYSKYELATFRLKDGDTTGMDNVLSNIPYNFDLDEEQQVNHQDYVNILNIFKTMKRDTISIFDLDSIGIDTLENIAATCLHYPAAWARAVLEKRANDIEDRYREEIPDYLGGGQRMEAPYRNTPPREDYSQFKIYPNPAREYFALEYNVQKLYFELSLIIIDITGKKVYSKLLSGQKSQSLISLADFKSGLYMVNLIGDGTIIKSEKLSILK